MATPPVRIHALVRHAILTAIVFGSLQRAYGDDIRVFSGGAPQVALRALTTDFEQKTGHKIIPTYALVTELERRLVAGETADLILLPKPLIAALERRVAMRAEGRETLARVGIAVIGRAGAAKADVSSPEAIRKLLTDAKTIAFPEPDTPSGAHLQRVLEQLGIAEEVRARIIVKAAIAGGGELVANGTADVGMYLLSEVQSVKGAVVLGLLPPALQSYVVYGSAIPADNATPAPGLSFLKFVSEPEKAQIWAAAGFELIERK